MTQRLAEPSSGDGGHLPREKKSPRPTTQGRTADLSWIRRDVPARTVRGERTRQRIIAAAEELFVSCGSFDAVSVSDIARAGGSSVGSVYRYFGDKEDLLLLIINNSLQRMYTAARAVWDSESAVVVNLERTTKAYLFAYWRERSLHRVALALMYRSDNVRKVYLAMRRDLVGRMLVRLRRDQAVASQSAPLDPEVTLRALSGMVDDYARRAFVDEEYGVPSEDDIPAIAVVLARIWYRAIDEPSKSPLRAPALARPPRRLE